MSKVTQLVTGWIRDSIPLRRQHLLTGPCIGRLTCSSEGAAVFRLLYAGSLNNMFPQITIMSFVCTQQDYLSHFLQLCLQAGELARTPPTALQSFLTQTTALASPGRQQCVHSIGFTRAFSAVKESEWNLPQGFTPWRRTTLQ